MPVNEQARAVLDLMGEQPLDPQIMTVAELHELTNMPATGLPALQTFGQRVLREVR